MCVWLSAKSQNVTQTYNLATQQQAEGNYSEAALLYRRVLLFDTANVYSMRVCEGLAESLAQGQNYVGALDYLSWAYRFARTDMAKQRIAFRKAEMYLFAEQPNYAIIELFDVEGKPNSDTYFKKSFLLGVAYFINEDFSKAAPHFLACVQGETNMEEQINESLTACLRADKRFPKYVKYFSLVVPGSAQFIYGSRESGLNSLVLVSVFGGIYYFTRQKYGFIDAWLGVFPWYLRYYQGGFENAEKLRLTEKERYINKHYRQIISTVAKEN